MTRFVEHIFPIVAMMTMVWSMLFYRENQGRLVEVRRTVSVRRWPDPGSSCGEAAATFGPHCASPIL